MRWKIIEMGTSPIADSELLPEIFAVALVSEAGVATFGIVQLSVVAAVRAVLLAPHLADNRLVGGADLVGHVVHKPVASNLGPDDLDLFLWNPDRLVTLRTDIHAQPRSPDICRLESISKRA